MLRQQVNFFSYLDEIKIRKEKNVIIIEKRCCKAIKST
jgi:hypothetical protein